MKTLSFEKSKFEKLKEKAIAAGFITKEKQMFIRTRKAEPCEIRMAGKMIEQVLRECKYSCKGY